MSNYLELKVDKFTFQVATDRFYHSAGVWAKWEGEHVVVGISDYLQKRSGDVAFAEVKPTGTLVSQDEEVAVIETIKVNISLPSPLSGKIMSINQGLATTPEIINQDPYGSGWLATIQVLDFTGQVERLLDGQAYYEKIKQELDQEARNNG